MPFNFMLNTAKAISEIINKVQDLARKVSDDRIE